ncbi:MAG UNVERIFIED_CONTAM: hypothetical protein LVR29_12020 [Microcystis novacekii LVE1205-3]|jgi:hypothetical protein
MAGSHKVAIRSVTSSKPQRIGARKKKRYFQKESGMCHQTTDSDRNYADADADDDLWNVV